MNMNTIEINPDLFKPCHIGRFFYIDSMQAAGNFLPPPSSPLKADCFDVFKDQITKPNRPPYNDFKNPDFVDSSVSCVQKKQDRDDGSLLREEVEMVMEELTLFCGPGGEELPEKIGSREVSGLFEEKEPSLEEVKEAFDVYDQNKDGFIDARELQRVLRVLGFKEGFELENCRKMIGKFDENGDGMIDFREFVKFMENSFVEL
ncbi:hypothetical protein Patl1_21893 [Pistacia atlantica]|uniref:Uncharacterized protein n=1 Tax=Pistacia atlantica TaxID=434234 RepID=A0ACC1BM65_9ROSI|nr:hypothetical protein Patl1_21893 [Pistacia atlantica]